MPVNLDEDDILGDLIQELDKPVITKATRLVHNKVTEKIKRENQTRYSIKIFIIIVKLK